MQVKQAGSDVIDYRVLECPIDYHGLVLKELSQGPLSAKLTHESWVRLVRDDANEAAQIVVIDAFELMERTR